MQWWQLLYVIWYVNKMHHCQYTITGTVCVQLLNVPLLLLFSRFTLNNASVYQIIRLCRTLSCRCWCLIVWITSYLSTMCQPVAINALRCHLRSAARGDIAVAATRTVRYGPRSFAVTGASMWNYLPVLLYAASTFHPRSVAIWKLNCSSERIISTLVTVCRCKSGWT